MKQRGCLKQLRALSLHTIPEWNRIARGGAAKGLGKQVMGPGVGRIVFSEVVLGECAGGGRLPFEKKLMARKARANSKKDFPSGNEPTRKAKGNGKQQGQSKTAGFPSGNEQQKGPRAKRQRAKKANKQNFPFRE